MTRYFRLVEERTPFQPRTRYDNKHSSLSSCFKHFLDINTLLLLTTGHDSRKQCLIPIRKFNGKEKSEARQNFQWNSLSWSNLVMSTHLNIHKNMLDSLFFTWQVAHDQKLRISEYSLWIKKVEGRKWLDGENQKQNNEEIHVKHVYTSSWCLLTYKLIFPLPSDPINI
jgi:hypothetical protein